MNHHDLLHCFSFDQQDFAVNSRTMIASRISRESAAYLCSHQSPQAFESLPEKSKSEIDDLVVKPGMPEQDTSSEPPHNQDPEGKSKANGAWDGSIDCIALFVTQRCNLRCTYCYGSGGEYGNPGVMDERTAMRAVDWLLEHCGNAEARISFFGGEPFLNFPLMKKVAVYARHEAEKRGITMNFTVTTNLTLLDREKLDFIRDFDVMTIASFDGPKETFDALRPSLDDSSAFDRAMAMLPELLAERGKMVNARATLLPDSDPEAVQAAIDQAGFLRSHMARAARSLFDYSVERKSFSPLEENRHGLAVSNITSFLEALQQRDEVKIKAYAKSYAIDLPSRDHLFDRNRVFLGRKKYVCGVGRMYVAVSTTGDIYPCHRFTGQEKYRLGSIFSKEPVKPDFQTSPVDAAEKCRNCWTRYMCGGGCLHEHAGESGDVRIPDEHLCDFTKRQNELKIALWCNISRDDYKWLEECGAVSSKNCMLDFG